MGSVYGKPDYCVDGVRCAGGVILVSGFYRELQEAVIWMEREKFKGRNLRMRVPMPSTVAE